MNVYGLLITKDDHEAFGDWCRDQLPYYKAVVCLDGSERDDTARQAKQFSERLVYLHERQFDIPSKGDHGLRRVVHDELIKRFGLNIWIMCCHTDEFCYHDPRKIAAKAERDGYDGVSWFSPHFYPHPSELPDLPVRLRRPVHERFFHYHWSHFANGLPWIEDRLYKAGVQVSWDQTTHGSVRPHGLGQPAPFYPIFRHFKVCTIDLSTLETGRSVAHYRNHWQDQLHRTGLPFRVERIEDLFVTSVKNYSCCTRFNGRFDTPWNMGDEFRPDGNENASPQDETRRVRTHSAPLSPTTVLDLGSGVGRLVNPERENEDRPIIAFGPRLPEYGSWNWVGADIAESLTNRWDIRIFDEQIPPCDLVVFVKFKPNATVLHQIARQSCIIYCPIDFYGSASEICADASSLMACDRVLIHCERLRKYFTPYAAVEYMDHHVKFAASLRREFVSDGPLLWVGVRSNLSPLVEFVNANKLPDELWILTNPENPTVTPSPVQYGFRSERSVRIDCWTPERQREWTGVCRGAFDVKARDFRAHHKPPAKGIDFIASGVPLAIESDSSTAEHLGRMGFDVAAPDDPYRWLSRDYWDQTVRFGAALGELLSKKRVVHRFERIIEEVLAERRVTKE